MQDHQALIERLAEEIAQGRRQPPTLQEVGSHVDAGEGPAADLSVSAAAAQCGMEASTVRYYEDAGLLTVPRRSNGHRVFTARALDELIFVHRLRLSGMPIRQIARLRELMGEDSDDGQGSQRGRTGQAGQDDGDPTGRVRPSTEDLAQARGLLDGHAAAIRRQIAQLQVSLAITEYKISTLTPAP